MSSPRAPSAAERAKVTLPPPGYVRLVSADNHQFLISARHARVSNVLAAILDGGFLEGHTRTVHLPDIPAQVLEKVCQYLHFAVRQQNCSADAAPASVETFDVPTDLTKDVFSAALYLDL